MYVYFEPSSIFMNSKLISKYFLRSMVRTTYDTDVLPIRRGKNVQIFMRTHNYDISLLGFRLSTPEISVSLKCDEVFLTIGIVMS